jgi:hypothetical protein
MNKYTLLILLIITFICIIIKYRENEFMSNPTEYIPYWEVRKIRNYEDCAWLNIPSNKETINVLYNDDIIQKVVSQVIQYYQKQDYVEQFQYRVFNAENSDYVKLTKYNLGNTLENNFEEIKYYSIKLNIYRMYVNNNNYLYNSDLELQLDQLKNSQGFELNVLFKVIGNDIMILKVQYLRPIVNEKYFYNI